MVISRKTEIEILLYICYTGGSSYNNIAEYFGMSYSQVLRYMTRLLKSGLLRKNTFVGTNTVLFSLRNDSLLSSYDIVAIKEYFNALKKVNIVTLKILDEADK